MDVTLPIWQLYDATVKATRMAAVNTPLEKYSEHMRKGMCDFQLRYTNYHFGASQLHRDFKESITTRDSYFDRLNDHIEKGLKTICGDIAQEIIDYFSDTHLHIEKPRVGIHAVSDENEVIDIIMLPTGSNNLRKNISDYTVFNHVQMNGLPYLENNLPRSAKKNDSEFLHSGLDVNRVRQEYKQPFSDTKLVARLRNNYIRTLKPDECWNRMKANTDANQSTFYKSHLVVPITYRHHATKEILDDRLIEALKIQDAGRAILGFVCVDHPATYYFDHGAVNSYQNIDINALYVFADMLSLVIITNFIFTVGSKSYTEYESTRGDSNGTNDIAPTSS